jgi:hypothetical protein
MTDIDPTGLADRPGRWRNGTTNKAIALSSFVTSSVIRRRKGHRLGIGLELNRSAHHWDERNRLLSPENGIGSAIEVVE